MTHKNNKNGVKIKLKNLKLGFKKKKIKQNQTNPIEFT